MTKKQLCEICIEYSEDIKCEIKNFCELQKILTENTNLKKELRQVKSELKELKNIRSWERNPERMGR
ncbi:MAG: hypothetical protein J6T10_22420 [Methanobrevibacter sp.]|nr:hypothetical protein [Methanobrevibacter sp.]